MGEMKEQLAANERKLREANAAMQADMESMAKRMEASNSKLAQLADEAGDTKVIPTPSHVLDRISPIFAPCFPVFCAFSPPRRDGSNEPQAGTQGQETAGKRAKRGELPPSFDASDANQRINCQGELAISLGFVPLHLLLAVNVMPWLMLFGRV